MSLANVRKHWRFLAAMLAIFVAIAAAGPLIFYGLGPLFAMIFDAFGGKSVLVIALIFMVFSLGWLFVVLWVSNKADQKLDAKQAREMDVNG